MCVRVYYICEGLLRSDSPSFAANSFAMGDAARSEIWICNGTMNTL